MRTRELLLIAAMGTCAWQAGCASWSRPLTRDTLAASDSGQAHSIADQIEQHGSDPRWWQFARKRAAAEAPQPESATDVLARTGRYAVLDEEEPDPVARVVTAPIRGAKRLVTPKPDAAAAAAAFDEGKKLFDEKQFAEAERKFWRAAKLAPDSPIEEEAWFMAGECQFFADRYSKANDTYGRVLKKYKNSRYLNEIVQRQFLIARYWEKIQESTHQYAVVPNLFDKTRPWFDTSGNALAIYESVHENDPTGPLADDSIMATANYYFVKERFDDADYYYGVLRDQYPKSDHQAMAHTLGLRSKLRKYQGPEYDGTALNEAEKLIEQASAQFPASSVDERGRLIRAREQVEAQMAQRDYEMGAYYERRKEFRAARIYYQRVAQQHPQTRFANMAGERLEAIRNEPDKPPQHFKWLIRLFAWAEPS